MNPSGETIRIVKPSWSGLGHSFRMIITRFFPFQIVIVFIISLFMCLPDEGSALNIAITFVSFLIVSAGLFILVAALVFLYFLTALLKQWHVSNAGILVRNLLRKDKFISFDDIRCMQTKNGFVQAILNKDSGPSLRFVSMEEINFVTTKWIHAYDACHVPVYETNEPGLHLGTIKPGDKSMVNIILFPSIIFIIICMAPLLLLLSGSPHHESVKYITDIGMKFGVFGLGVALLFLFIFLTNHRCTWLVFSDGVEVQPVLRNHRFIPYRDITNLRFTPAGIEISGKTWFSGYSLMFVSQDEVEMLSRAWARARVSDI